MTSKIGERPNKNPILTAHKPLMINEAIVIVVRPNWSAHLPANKLPIPPIAMTANAAPLAHAGPTPEISKLAKKKTEIHAHIAYSSHIWPK